MNRSELYSILMAVSIPGLQSLGTGILFALVAGAIALLLNYAYPWYAALCAGTWAALLAWLRFTNRWVETVYQDTRPVEVIEAGQNEPVTVLIANDDMTEGGYLDLPVSIDQVRSLADGLMNGATFSEAQWTGSGRPFTRGEFSALRAELIRRGLAAWNSPGTPARGVVLTKPGKAMMRYMCDLPSLGDGRQNLH
jgi:hypothetical protein